MAAVGGFAADLISINIPAALVWSDSLCGNPLVELRRTECEPAMLDTIRDMLVRTRDFISIVMRPPEFVCGDCERNQQCGLPPRNDCVQRAAQIASDPDGLALRARRRAELVRRTAGSL
jgi:hypothetical protein